MGPSDGTQIPSTTQSTVIKKSTEMRNGKSQPNETIPNVSSEILPEERDKDVTNSDSNSDLNLNIDLTRDLEQNETSTITSTKPPRPSKSIQLESTEKIDERVEAGISLKGAQAENQRIDRINPADGESELLRPRHEAQMAPTSTPLTFTVTATRPPLLIKPSIPPTPVLKKSSSSSSTSSSSFTTVTTTTVVPRSSSPVREHDNQQHSTTAATTTTTTSSSSLSSSPSSPPSSSSAPQSSMNDGSSEPTIMTFPEDINNLSSAMDNPEQSDTNANNEKHSDITTSALLSSTIDTQNLPSSDLKTSLQSSTIIPTTTTDTPAEYPFIYPPLKTTTMRLEPVTLEFIYNRHTPPPSSTTSTTTTPQAITTMTSASTVTRSSTRGTTRTMNPAVRPPKPVPSYNVVRTTVATATKRRGTGGTAQQQDNPPVRTSTSVQHKPPPVLIIDRPGSEGSNSVAASGSGSNITGRGVTLPGVIVTSMSPAGPTGAPIAPGVMMGLGSGAEIGIAAGSIVAFWLLLGPLVCIICRLRERAAAKSRGAGSSNQTERCLHDDGTGTIGTNGIAGDEEMGTRLVEEMIRMELARGRHKLYKTNVQDEHETQRLGDLSLNGGDYVNTEFLHPHIVQNDYAKNSMDRNNSCEKLPLSNGTLPEPLYANTLKVDRADRVPPPPPPPPPQNIDPLYANGIASSPLPPRPPPPPSSNGYVCSNNYPLSSAALYLAKSRPGPRIPPPPQSIRSPESEPVDGFMYSPRLLQRQLERAVRTEQKKEGGLRRSEKIFPVPDKFSNIQCEPKRNTPKYAVPEKKIEPAKKVEPIYAEPIRAEPKCHKKAGLINGYSKLPTHLPQASINTGHVGIPESPRIMPKHIQEEDEYEDDEFDELDLDDDGSLSRTPSPPASQRTHRDIPKSLSLSQSVERAIPLLLNGEKYRITSSNPSIDSGKYIINKGMSKSMERSNGLLPNIDKSSPLERNNGLLHHNTDQKNSPLDSAKSPLNGDCVLSPMNPEADPWKPRVKNNTKTVLNGKGPYRSRNSVEDSPISSSSSSPPKEIVPEINHDVQCKKQLCDQGTQTLVDTIKSPWIGYRRPGVKDTVV